MGSWPATPATRRHGRHRDVQLGELVDEPARGGLGDAAQLVGVGHGDLALHPQGAGALEHQVRAEDAQLAGLVEVDIDGDLVLFGEAEDDVQVPGGVAVQAARIDAAHDVGAGLECLPSMSGTVPSSRRRPACGNAMMSTSAWSLNCSLAASDGIETFEPAVDVDLGVGADAGGAARDHPPEGVVDPFLQRDLGVAPVLPVVHHHGPHARTAGVLAERQADAGRVQVHVDVGERRQQEPAAALDDRLRRQEAARAGSCGSTPVILPSLMQDVAQRLSPGTDGADQGVQCIAPFILGLLHTGEGRRLPDLRGGRPGRLGWPVGGLR